jgi:uncharacterized protein (TIGR02588 family)
VSGERAVRGPRRLAEWVTFGVSLALVLALSAHLAWRLREPVTDMIDARVTPRLDRVAEREGRFVLPLDIVNPGGRTIRDLQVRVEYRGTGGERRSMDLLVDYLGQSSEQVVYTYFRDDPRTLSIRAEAMSYRVD